MIIGRIIGWIFALAGLVVLVRDFVISFEVGYWAPIALGQLWYNIDRSSLHTTQEAIQYYSSREIWNTIDQTILMSWAFAVFMALGMSLLWIFATRLDHFDLKGRRNFS
jgi:hypothetical protein